MNLEGTHSKFNLLQGLGGLRLNRGLSFAAILLTALVAFEIFNYSTTDFALRDLLGDLRFAGVRWATILSIAFCGIDFAGIARLFTPEQGIEEPKEVWYLFGAWLLAATMNAMLTWWGISIAITNHTLKSSAVMDAGTLIKVAPIFVAIMVWVIRILIIGSFSVAGDRLLHSGGRRRAASTHERRGVSTSAMPVTQTGAVSARSVRPSSAFRSSGYPAPRPEPTYQGLSRNAISRNENSSSEGRQLS